MLPYCHEISPSEQLLKKARSLKAQMPTNQLKCASRWAPGVSVRNLPKFPHWVYYSSGISKLHRRLDIARCKDCVGIWIYCIKCSFISMHKGIILKLIHDNGDESFLRVMCNKGRRFGHILREHFERNRFRDFEHLDVRLRFLCEPVAQLDRHK